LQEVANSALGTRHWEQIFHLLGKTYSPDQTFALDDLLQWGIQDHIEAVCSISSAASKEMSLRKALDEMISQWDGLELLLAPYKESGTYIIGGVDEVQLLLDDHCMKAQAMAASPFVRPFQKEADSWQQLLNHLQVRCKGLTRVHACACASNSTSMSATVRLARCLHCRKLLYKLHDAHGQNSLLVAIFESAMGQEQLANQ
jgi:hypothetical protein